MKKNFKKIQIIFLLLAFSHVIYTCSDLTLILSQPENQFTIQTDQFDLNFSIHQQLLEIRALNVDKKISLKGIFNSRQISQITDDQHLANPNIMFKYIKGEQSGSSRIIDVSQIDKNTLNILIKKQIGQIEKIDLDYYAQFKLKKVDYSDEDSVSHLMKMISEQKRQKQELVKKNKELQLQLRFLVDSAIVKQPAQKKIMHKWLQQTQNKSQIFSKLLFRASENEFSAAAFHKSCDGFDNTLVIVKTEFDKVIGGFTPNKWNSEISQYINDRTGKSFIFSLTLIENYKCILPQYSTYSSKSSGPIFGGGFDLFLSDNAQSSEKSYAMLAHSYNLKVNGSNKYQYSQSTWTLFSGAKNVKTFKVKQYEVYQIKGM